MREAVTWEYTGANVTLKRQEVNEEDDEEECSKEIQVSRLSFGTHFLLVSFIAYKPVPETITGR